MKLRVPVGLAAGCTAAAVLLAAAGGGAVTRDAPPPAHTGGFGEPSCHECHFEVPVNSGTGSLQLYGLPQRYSPGAVYRLTLTLAHRSLGAAGFQLTARFADAGTRAGALRPAPADVTRADTTSSDGVPYLHHVLDGTAPVAQDTARWTFIWVAPAHAGTVVFNAAANAANDDDSPLGDVVYLLERKLTAGK